MIPLRIVLVMVEPPLPFGNAAARWFYVLLRGLVERGHRVTAFATCSNPDDIAKAAEIFPSPEYDLRCYRHPVRSGLRAKWQTFRQPYSYMFGDDLRRDLKAVLARGFDVLHLEQLWSAWLGLEHVDRALPNIHYLCSIDRSHAGRPRGLMPWVMDRVTRRAERRLLKAFPHQIALTERLANSIRKINPAAEVSVVPLAIDLDLYPFDPNPPRAPGAPPTVGLIGSFNWTPSFLAGRRLIERLWPAVHRQVPSARLLIVGRGAEQAFAAYRGKVPGLEIRSDVPDPIPHFREIDVLLYAPEVGSGIKVKIVEAMALGTAVVTNSEGIEGLGARDGIEAGVADDDAGLVERAVQYLQQPKALQPNRAAARTLVARVCAGDAVIDRLQNAYLSLIGTTIEHRSREIAAGAVA